MASQSGHSSEEISAALGHIAYEATMCATSAIRCAEVEYGLRRGDGDDRNAYLESALLHARNLYEFLCTDGRNNDLRRRDFGPDWKPTGEQQEAAARLLGAAQVDLHKHLAHLTWERVERPEPPGWAPVNVAYCALTLTEAWMLHVDDADEHGPLAPTTLLVQQVTGARCLLEPLGASVTNLIRRDSAKP